MVHDYGDFSLTDMPGKGRGLIAQRPFATGDLVTSSPVVVFPKDQCKWVHKTLLGDYVFHWPYTEDGSADDPESTLVACALGLGSLLNHAGPEANCQWDFNAATKQHYVRAARPIASGEELTLDYGYPPKGFAEIVVEDNPADMLLADVPISRADRVARFRERFGRGSKRWT